MVCQKMVVLDFETLKYIYFAKYVFICVKETAACLLLSANIVL